VQMAEWIRRVAAEPWMFLMLFNACLLLLGIFIEPLPAMLLSVALLFLSELYDDEAAIQAHLLSPHFLQMTTATAPWVEAKRVRQLRRTAP
jgi:hypothetical protein